MSRWSGQRRRPGSILLAGLALVVIGACLFIARYLVARYESHSYTDGRAPQRYVSVHAGARYWLAVPGGVKHEAALGQPPTALQCSAQVADGAELTIDVTSEAADTKMINIIGSFRSPVTGRVHVTCAGLGAVYLDSTSSDPSGVLLVLGTVALAIGFPLLLSGVRTVSTHPARVGLSPARTQDD